MNSQKRDYPVQPVPFTQVSIKDEFWEPRIQTTIDKTIPYDFKKSEETGRIDNFSKAAGLMKGAHEGIFFNDSDVFKIVEGAAYALRIEPNPELETYVDNVIEKMASAQEDDGYLYTARTIDPENAPAPCGDERWSNLVVNHELYNVGHMYEAAVAYYQATGKRQLLDVAIKNADLIAAVFGVGKRRDVPGHQEIEIGLVRLFRITGDEKYLRLAKFFLDERGQANDRMLYGQYCQDHLPVTEQTDAVGHAVRAAYMYSGMADVAALTGDVDYIVAIKGLWQNVVTKKLALTGGIGARHEGEAFGDDYELPNLVSYNETCAAQANIFWNHRLFLLTGESKYIDVLERTLYNGFLAGIGLDGESFFYVNPLACDGQFHFNRDNEITRQPWFETSCCPTNVVRLLPSLSGYIYAVQDESLYVNLYMSNTADIDMNGVPVHITQETNYPWDGRIRLSVGTQTRVNFALRLRLPGWVTNRPVPSDLYHYIGEQQENDIVIRVDGSEVETPETDGYAVIHRDWEGISEIEIDFAMSIRRVAANSKVDDLNGKVALERGPIVYTLEEIDNARDVFDIALSDDTVLSVEAHEELLNGVHVITGISDKDSEDGFMAVPYYAWGNRSAGKMTVWLNHCQE